MTIHDFMAKVAAKNQGEPEFLQAVKEVVETVWDAYISNPRFVKANILERIVEPERTIIFRVPWMDDKGEVHVQRGYRVQFNSAIGPYKGGLRFHPSVNLSILKFLGFEQIFKNSLTTLPMGGGKGGSDFDAKGKSDAEIMRFCQAFMSELFRHIGPNTDVPAGDIGVGGREIGYLFGMYKKLSNEFTGVLTGKGRNWGGSLIRPEATGFGAVYFAEEMLKTQGKSFDGLRVALSGFGNVAWGAAQKISELGGKVVTISGPDGYILDEEGISGDKIDYLLELRASNNDRVCDYADVYPNSKFFPGKRPWEVKVDVAMPCATQNELDLNDAKALVANACICIAEGANMPCTPEAVEIFINNKILFAPGKAANAGGVATSGLEMTQNSMRFGWSRDEVDARLHEIMKNIHEACATNGKQADGFVNYVKGANIAGFLKVANAMCDMGVV
ncbi:MAG: NADP-specific glutamate dehydrogenase [Candidatus Cloacimonetes bacterium HGW-Cloacimonetes-3]|jgi:glutamate dehydrogenase (NADP+)|nr:MAG: NADP-specific glutamate dehydrogenase [Candidatus Cloacimonetes bacterium HGW-Cloacimonetes-3]